jgi:hypothetical protein
VVALALVLASSLLLGEVHGAWNLDEEGLLFSTWQLQQGRLCMPGDASLRSVHTVLVDGLICSKYPPGASLLYLLPGRLGPALATGAAVLGVGLVGRQLDARHAGWLALGPLLLVNGSLYLAEVPALAGIALALASRERPLLGGLGLGFAVLCKPVLGALALPFVLLAVGWRVLPGFALGLLGVALHDLWVTGSPWTLPYTLYAPTDHPGFGADLGGSPLEFGAPTGHTPLEGLGHTAFNALGFAMWAGGHGGLLLAAPLGLRGAPRLGWALGGFGLALVALYFAYWFPGVHHAGPIYWVPLVLVTAPLAARAAEGWLLRVLLITGLPLAWVWAGMSWNKELSTAVAERAELLDQPGTTWVEGPLSPVANVDAEAAAVYRVKTDPEAP